jgi:NAD+ diphosphatase
VHGPRVVFLGLHEVSSSAFDGDADGVDDGVGVDVDKGGNERSQSQTQALPSTDFSGKGPEEAALAASKIEGVPYFCVDVSEVDEGVLKAVLNSGGAAEEKPQSESGLGFRYGYGYRFMEPRAAAAGFTRFEAAVFAEARSMVDWNARNKVCLVSFLFFFLSFFPLSFPFIP